MKIILVALPPRINLFPPLGLAILKGFTPEAKCLDLSLEYSEKITDQKRKNSKMVFFKNLSIYK